MSGTDFEFWAIALSTLAVALVAVCVWLTVLSLPVLYVGNFGPACWISGHLQPSRGFVSAACQPVLMAWLDEPEWLRDTIWDYAEFGCGRLTFATSRSGVFALFR